MFDNCMLWSGYKDKWGYGRKGNGILAHRYVYEQLVGVINKDMELDHLCNSPPCFNVDHLEPVTHHENMRRLSNRVTHCSRGHEYSVENTYIQPKGSKTCKKCQAIAVSKYEKGKKYP